MKNIMLIIIFVIFAVPACNDDFKDPSSVLERAREKVKQKEYAEALENYVWFFDNSSKINQSLLAVKLSVCLTEWRELGNVYEPALIEFRRELSERKDRLEKGEADLFLFIEFSAFCKSDNNMKDAIDIFMKFHNSKNQTFAKSIFQQIQYELAGMGYYDICNEYIDNPLQTFEVIKYLCELDVESYNREAIFVLSVLKKNNRDKEYEAFKDKVISYSATEELKAKILELEKENEVCP